MSDSSDYRFVAVLNTQFPSNVLHNAIGHMALGMFAIVNDEERLRLRRFFDADHRLHACLTDAPLIILGADDPNRLRELWKSCSDRQISVTSFTTTHLTSDPIAQEQDYAHTAPEDLTFLGVLMFGTKKELRKLTSGLSLMGGSDSVPDSGVTDVENA